MAIDQCADDSAGIRVVELVDGTMQWQLVAADASIQVVDFGDPSLGYLRGVRSPQGRGLTKQADGKLAWGMEVAGRFRTSAGSILNLTQASGNVVLQELRGHVANTSNQSRDMLAVFCLPWFDVVETDNPAAMATVNYGYGLNAVAQWQEIAEILSDNTGSLRRTRTFGGSIVDYIKVPANSTMEVGMQVVTSAGNGTGSYTPYVPGMRVDCFFLGGAAPMIGEAL